jgi:flagellum-specific peptidoglycan hydrolase FlgJ
MLSAINSATSNALSQGSPDTRAVGTHAFEQSLARVGARTVEAQRTRLTPDEASRAIREALNRATGTAPNDQTVALLTAQWAHETAHGASMYNYNFGGIKGTGPSGLTVAQRTKEGWGHNERSVTDHFRAYESAQDGANDYVKLLMAHYPEALTAASRGDASGFVHGLKQRGYFTGDERAYERSVTSISAGLLDGNYSANARGNVTPVTDVSHVANLSAMANVAGIDANAQVGNSRLSVAPLVPTALVSAVSQPPGGVDSPRNPFVPDDIQTVSALSMADEVVRAALFEHSSRAKTETNNTPERIGNPLVG